MFDFVKEHWFDVGLVFMLSALILGYGIGWIFGMNRSE